MLLYVNNWRFFSQVHLINLYFYLMYGWNDRYLCRSIWIRIHRSHPGLYPVLLYHSYLLGFQIMYFLVICPWISMRDLPYAVYLFDPARSYYMFLWASFGALVLCPACDHARLGFWLFTWFYSYFRSDAYLRVRMISLFFVQTWTHRKLLGVFIYW